MIVSLSPLLGFDTAGVKAVVKALAARRPAQILRSMSRLSVDLYFDSFLCVVLVFFRGLYFGVLV